MLSATPPPVQDVPGGAGQHPGHRGHGRLGAQDRGPAGGQDGGAGDQSEGGVWSRDPAVSCYWPGRGGRLGPGAAAGQGEGGHGGRVQAVGSGHPGPRGHLDCQDTEAARCGHCSD